MVASVNRPDGDIMDALASVRYAFRRANLEAPTTLLLANRDEGMRFLGAVRGQVRWSDKLVSVPLGSPVEMADGSMWMEMEVMGMKVRWPADRIATPDGRWGYM